MNTPRVLPSAAVAARGATAPARPESADDLIFAAELEVIARDRRLQRHTRQLVDRLQSRATKTTAVAVVGGIAIAGGAIWLLRRKREERWQRDHPPRAGQQQQQHAAVPPAAGWLVLPALLQLVPMVLQALPQRLRDRVPALATAATWAAPLAAVFRGRGRAGR